MPGINTVEITRATFTLKSIDAPSTTLTVKCDTRSPIIDPDSWQILENVSGIGAVIGQSGDSVKSNGTISLNDRWQSFGNERKFSDLLERYAIIEQAVTISIARENLSATSATFTSIFTGVVRSISRSGDGRLTIQVASKMIADTKLTKVIDQSMAPTGDVVPDSSVGRELPIIFSNSAFASIGFETAAYSLSSLPGASSDYAFAIQLNDEFPNSITYAYIYLKTDDGRFLTLDSSVSSHGFGGSYEGGSLPTASGITEIIVPIGYDNAPYGFLATAASWFFKGQNNGGISPVGTIKFNLYVPETLEGLRTENPVRTAQVSKTDYYTEVRGATDFWVDASFDTPIVLETKYDLGGGFKACAFLGMVQTAFGSTSNDFVSAGTNGLSALPQYMRASDSGGIVAVGGEMPLGNLWPAGLDRAVSTAVDASGFKYVYIKFKNQVTTDDGVICDLTNLQPVVKTAGIQEGTPVDLMKMLSYSWNGSEWADTGLIDLTGVTVSPSRSLCGSSQEDKTSLSLLARMLKETGGSLIPLSNGKLSAKWWGQKTATSKVLTDEDLVFRGFRITDAGSIINKVDLTYEGTLTANIPTWVLDAGVKGKGGAASFPTRSNLNEVYDLSIKSLSLFGERREALGDVKLLNDIDSIKVFAWSLLARYWCPEILFSISLDAYEHKDIEIGDVLEVITVHLPCFFGTDQNPKLPNFSGTVDDINNGIYAKRAKRYRSEVVGRSIEAGIDVSQTLKLDLRIIPEGDLT